ncbi:MAG: hypothetical protein A2639_01505 [Candidatus Staskawiczbacteria bacterium RIFCSPHIGHO2_01_FULL_34_27]|uniref:Uncharacterized protein n=1 Tax=Candidatus Staskawiczbacteria bacterium RIFCSPHIGHO2_01_FULL_34_27 TaxID=1802199 RepID=A0A1G2HKD4_9BACT|nr:MAG: hypothetical protein A2639_01505 [Candidatus Staskawiczbacteria bacterium RIFCSPHIGHO2_01_FULL_34_27]
MGYLELALQKEKSLLCKRLGHKFKMASPIKTRKENRQVLYQCKICDQEAWLQWPEDSFNKLSENAEKSIA